METVNLPDTMSSQVFDLVISPRSSSVPDVLVCVRQWADIEKAGGLINAWAKFRIARLIESSKRHHGDKIVQEASEVLGCARTYIYEWLPIALLTDVEARKVLKETPTLAGLKRAAGDKQRALGVFEDEKFDAIQYKETRIQKLTGMLAREVEDLVIMKQRTGALDDVPAIPIAVEEVRDARDALEMETEYCRDDGYLDFVRSLPCCICGAVANDYTAVHPHHTEVGGMGIKGSDLSCVPLCAVHHQEVEGTEGFWCRHEKEVAHIGWMVARRYIQWLRTS